MTTQGAGEEDFTPLAFGTSPDGISLEPPPTTSPVTGVVVAGSAPTAASSAAVAVVPELPLVQLALAGSVASWIADITMHPIDCIKTVQQSDSGIDLTFVGAAELLYRTGGVLAFYQGFFTYACADAVGGALKFAVWEMWKKNDNVRSWFAAVPWLQLWAGAALAFVASSVVIVPGELIKQQLQMGHYHSLLETVVGIQASTPDGISGFFVGYDGVLYRDVPYTMLELGLYESIKILWKKTHSEDSDGDLKAWQEVVAAAVTGGITALATTPLDTVKTKMMVDAQYLDMNFLESLLASVQANGWQSLFAGVWARIAWIIPFTALYLPTYDSLKRFLWNRHIERQQQSESEDQKIISK